MTQPSTARRGLRRTALTAALAALAVSTLPMTAPAATAAEASSAVVVDVASWFPTGVGSLTVSKTTGLSDGEQITVSGVLPVRPTSAGGLFGGFLQTASSYAPDVVTKLTDTPAVRATKTAVDPVPSGWRLASHVEATVTVHTAFTTGPNSGDKAASPEGVAVDCKVEQCFLALAPSVWSIGGSALAGSNMPDSPAVWVPISFQGGNAELARDVAPSVTSQPADTTVAAGETAVFRAAVEARPAPAYRWQTSADDGATWTDLSGATSPELSVAAQSTDDGRVYRAVAANRQGAVTTRAATLSVTSAPVAPGTDDGKWALGQPGSWATVSAFSHLTDGQQITIEAEYVGLAATDNRPASWAMPVSQGGFGWPNDRWQEGQWSPTDHKESTAAWVQATAIGGDRYRGAVTYTVRDTLPDPISGKTYDCRVTQCYLYVGGTGFDAAGRQLEKTTDQLSYLGRGGSSRSDHDNSVLIPLYFEGGAIHAQTRSAPSFSVHPASQTIEENNAAKFTVTTAGLPEATVTWQRSTDGGQTWRTIGGATGTTYSPLATPALNHVQYRAVAVNALGATSSAAATLTVTAAGDAAGAGVTLDWTGSAELQGLAPNRQPNYFSAGVSEGSKASYRNLDGDAKIVWRTSGGSEVLKTYDTRATHIAQGGQQIVRLSNGSAALDAAGAGTISWNASWTVNFYGGLVPFTITNPRLTIDDAGAGTLVADLSGYGSSMDDPGTKVPLEPAKDVVVSTFSSVSLRDGALTVAPDYAGVRFDAPADSTSHPQDRTVSGWGAWPQSFVDYHFKTGLTSYWYTSGGSADALKPGLPFTISGITLPPATAPSAPAAPTATAVSGAELDVSWARPGTGGSPITGYTVTVAHGGETVATVPTDGAALSARVTGLTPGTTYDVTVVAANAVGTSPVSAATSVATHGAPTAPAAPALAAGSGTSLVATWAAPASDGGSAVTGYDVTLRSGGDVVATRTTDATTTTFEGLARGASYTVAVAARNALGVSAASAASVAVEIAALVPDAPTAPVLTPGIGALVATWTAPAANGSAITGYTVTATPRAGGAAATADVTATTATLTGLARGAVYDVTVVATNAKGASAASAATTATTLAEAPKNLAAPTVAVLSGTALSVAWVAPGDDGGSAVTGYDIVVRRGDAVVKTVHAAATDVSASVEGLARGTAYTVTVTAVNGVGRLVSPASAPATTFDVPAVPVASAELSGTRGVRVAWAAPADGGTPLTGYVVTLRSGDTVLETRALALDASSITIDGIAPGTDVTATVVARNLVGDSGAGTTGVVRVPAVAPDAPATPVVTATAHDSATVTWTAPAVTGGSPVAGYRVSLAGPDGVTVHEVAATATSEAFTALAPGAYTAAVVAVNAVGASEPSAASAAVTLPQPPVPAHPVADQEPATPGAASVSIDGQIVTIRVGEAHRGQWIGATVHSSPVFLGWFRADANGAVTLDLRDYATQLAGLEPGAHNLIVHLPDGTVLARVVGALSVDAPATAAAGSTVTARALPATGVDGGAIGWTAAAALLLLAAGAAITIGRRRAMGR